MNKLLERLRIISEAEEGEEFELIKPLDSSEARMLHVRVDDPKKYPVGTKLYFAGEVYDDDGFWWIDFVTDKNLLSAGSMGSGQPGVIRFTPARYRDVFNVVASV